MHIKYHPIVCSPGALSEEVVQDAYVGLLRDHALLLFTGPVTLGYDTQYDRTVDGSGNPGEYIQFYIMWGDEE